MKKMVFTPPGNGIELRCVHVMHHESLIFDHMLGSIQEGQEKDADEFERTGGWRELQEEFNRWPINEAMKYGVMSLYHLWERQTKSLISEQLGKVPSPKPDAVSAFLKTLKEELSADALPEHHATLHECRKLTNLIKHDTGDGYDNIMKAYPAYFVSGGEAAEDRFRVPPAELRRLFKGVIAFWEHIETQIEVDWAGMLNQLARS